jgi:hypothetical protein
MSSESIQIIANNNYEGLQTSQLHIFTKKFSSKFKEIGDDETDPKVRRYVGIFYMTLHSQLMPAASYA